MLEAIPYLLVIGTITAGIYFWMKDLQAQKTLKEEAELEEAELEEAMKVK